LVGQLAGDGPLLDRLPHHAHVFFLGHGLERLAEAVVPGAGQDDFVFEGGPAELTGLFQAAGEVAVAVRLEWPLVLNLPEQAAGSCSAFGRPPAVTSSGGVKSPSPSKLKSLRTWTPFGPSLSGTRGEIFSKKRSNVSLLFTAAPSFCHIALRKLPRSPPGTV